MKKQRCPSGTARKVAPEVLRLKMQGKKHGEIANKFGIGKSTVAYIMYNNEFADIRKEVGFKRGVIMPAPSSPKAPLAAKNEARDAILRFPACSLEVGRVDGVLVAKYDSAEGVDVMREITQQEATSLTAAAAVLRKVGLGAITFVALPDREG